MRGPEIHGHSPDPTLPTVRIPQGIPSTPACWRHCWRRQGWRIPTCRTPPTGIVPSLDIASGHWALGVPGVPPIPAWDMGASFLCPWKPGVHNPPPPHPSPTKQCQQPCPVSAGSPSARSRLSAGSRCPSFPQRWLRFWSVATGPRNLHPLPASAASLVPAACYPTAQLQLVAPHRPRR